MSMLARWTVAKICLCLWAETQDPLGSSYSSVKIGSEEVKTGAVFPEFENSHTESATAFIDS